MLGPGRLQQRSRLLQSVRSFFIDHQYLEVDTPIRLPVILPERHISFFQSEDRFLQTSPELAMKLLLGHGNCRIFQICHCFRKFERGRNHSTEFTMLEWYHQGWNYRDLMDECELLLQFLVCSLSDFPGLDSAERVKRSGRNISLTSPWDRLSVDEAFLAYAGIPAAQALEKGHFDELLVTRVEPNLGWDKPLFLYDYPAPLASLARRKPDDNQLAERFELYVGGLELANGYSELCDPAEQRKRFEQEIELINDSSGLRLAMPEKFLSALERMGETAGIALGFDRLFMLLLGEEDISKVMVVSVDDVVGLGSDHPWIA